jgi:hypothetical protein
MIRILHHREMETPSITMHGDDRMPFTTKVGCACEVCNTGWMHELEETAKPILRPLIQGRMRGDKPRILHESRQSVVGTWAIKTAMVLDELYPEYQAIPRDYYDPFRRHQRPLAGTTVWMGRYEGAHPHVYYAAALEFPGLRKIAPEAPEIAAYGATIGIGHLVLRVFVTPIEIDVTPVGDTARRLTQIWPTSPVVEWPPELAVDDTGVPLLLQALWEETSPASGA